MTSVSSPLVVSHAAKAAQIKKTKPVCPFSKIESLHPNSRGDNFLVQVIDIRVVLERTKIDGTPLKIAEVLVGDSTGTVLLTCKNEQVSLAQVGSWLTLRNAKVQMFSNRIRLAVDRWGLIEALPLDAQKPQEKVATEDEKNVSLPEYQLIECPQ